MADTDAFSAQYRDPMVHDLHLRVSHIEQSSQLQRTELAVVQNDLTYVKEAVGGISRGINKILWAISLSVLTAATTFVLSGGFTLNF